jgi:hypothetical protein
LHKENFELLKHKALVIDGIPMEFFHKMLLKVGKRHKRLLVGDILGRSVTKGP